MKSETSYTRATRKFNARASHNRLALSNEQFVEVANGSVIPGVRGQHLEVRTLIAREACGQNPYLENLTICSLSKTLTLIAPPTDQSVQEGDDAAFEVIAIGTEPLTYQWLLNGSPVGPNSPVLSLLAVDCLDAGAYTVHITDASGDEVDAGPAFLDVFPRIVTIPLIGTASIYPMQITVSGAPTIISSVEVVLNGFKHDRPDDVDILLVPPNPAPAIMLMSDAGGSTAVQNLTLTFSQSGGLLPDEGQLFTGTFAAANFGDPETSFPAGNPTPPGGPYSTDLSLLNSINPNGVWNLYIVDDTNQRSGFVSGSWCLILNP